MKLPSIRKSLLLAGLLLPQVFSAPSFGQGQPPSDPPDEKNERAESGPLDPQPKPTVLKEIVVTATRRESPLFTLPNSGRVFDRDTIALNQQSRSTPEILQDVPSVLVQKTAQGQGSPFIRGFTGYRNLFLIDGIRLNNSTFRSGPNQYWSTVDHLGLERLELIYGPASVLYGSDAVGGAVNALTRKRLSYEPGLHLGGRVFARYSTAEDSFTERVEFEGNQGESLGFVGGVSMKSFGDLTAGSGSRDLANTAYDQFDADLRFDLFPTDKLQWTLLYQHSSQDDVPRTHRTVRSKSFHGTTVGPELRRDLDQQRDLAYSRWTLDEPVSFLDRVTLTFSFQRQEQKRDRLRSGGRRDLSGFHVNTWGAILQAEKETPLGLWTFGSDYYYDSINSFRDNYRGGAYDSTDIQGPLGDEADSSLLGFFAQNEFSLLGIDWVAGVRLTSARVDADRVDNPEVPGSDPTTPGNVISITDTFRNAVGSLRGSAPVHGEDWRIFFGASQGFRSPTVHDLTSFDSTSVFEVPTQNLDPENFLTLEVGVKADSEGLSGKLTGYYTFIDDLIVASPTGEVRENTPVVQKDNIGDGYVAGIEAEASYPIDREWSIFGAIGWQSGKVDQIKFPSGEKVDKPIDRLMPLSGIVGARLQPENTGLWLEAFTRFADDQSRLSLRDQSDTERIPPGGTPGWATLNLRTRYQANEAITVSAALENITNKDYRIHGSGQNEAGRNLIVSCEVRF